MFLPLHLQTNRPAVCIIDVLCTARVCVHVCRPMCLPSSVFVHVSDPPTGVPCPGAGVFVVSAEPWVRPVGTGPASLLCLPRFRTHPILCAVRSALPMRRWRVCGVERGGKTHRYMCDGYQTLRKKNVHKYIRVDSFNPKSHVPPPLAVVL